MPDQSTPDRPPGLDALLDHVAAHLSDTFTVLAEVAHERARQDDRWGEQNHPDGTGGMSQVLAADAVRRGVQRAAAEGRQNWVNVLGEEVAEAFAESDPARLRAELLQVAAVAVCWVESIDRRAAGGEQA